MGGVRRSYLDSTSRGIPGFGPLARNRAVGGDLAGGGVSVHTTVIDHEALDEAVLAAAARRRVERMLVEKKGAELSATLRRHRPGSSAESSGLMSVAEIRRQNAAQKAARQQQALQLFAQGEAAATQGKAGVARIYYQMAHRRASAELQQRIAARLAALPTPADKK